MRSNRLLSLAPLAPLAPLALAVVLANCRTAVDWTEPSGHGGASGTASSAGASGDGAGASGSGGLDARGGASGSNGIAGGEAGGAEFGGASGAPSEAGGGEAGGAEFGGASGAPSEAGDGGEGPAGGGGMPASSGAGPDGSPWLVFASYFESSVQAVRLDPPEAERRETLRTIPSDNSVSEFWWSPSGRYLVFPEAWSEDELYGLSANRLLWAGFGRGLPTRATPIVNLPNSGKFFTSMWDTETDAMAVTNGFEAYVVRFHEDRADAELALISDQEYDLSLCRGAAALIYYTADHNYLVPVGSAPSEWLELGKYVYQSPDLSQILLLRVGRLGTEEVFRMDCRAGAEPVTLRRTPGFFSAVGWSPDQKLLLIAEGGLDRPRLEIVPDDDPESVIFSGEFTSGSWSSDGSLLLLESTSPGSRWNVLELEHGVPEPLPLDDTAEPAWCGRYLLLASRNPETGAERLHVVDLRGQREPRVLIPESPDELGRGRCDSAGEHYAYPRYISGEQRIEVITLATPDTPPLVYPLGPRIEIQLRTFDERGLLAALPGPEMRTWWLPMQGAVAGTPRLFSGAQHPQLQPLP